MLMQTLQEYIQKSLVKNIIVLNLKQNVIKYAIYPRTWFRRLHTVIYLSITVAEHVVLSKAAREVFYLRDLIL